MNNFIFSAPTKIIFGKDTESKVGMATREHLGDRVLLHYGRSSVVKSGLKDRIKNYLVQAGVRVFELGGVVPNPRLSLVRDGIGLCRENDVGGVLAIGGGSVIDSAKAIALGVPYSGDVWDFFSGKIFPESALPVGVVLTLPGSGSEAGGGVVITNLEHQQKLLAWSELVIPRFAIMNPELTYSLPPYQTACGGVDILSHVLERYFTNVSHVDLTDRLCEATMSSVIHHLPIALAQPENYPARAELMWAGSLAHNGLLDTGRVGDWACHAIEHELSGLYDVAHGAGLAVLLPAWMTYVLEHDLDRFAQFAVRVWHMPVDHKDPKSTALEGVRRTASFFRQLGLPPSLTELGIEASCFPEVAKRCTHNGQMTVGNFVKLDAEDIVNILEIAK